MLFLIAVGYGFGVAGIVAGLEWWLRRECFWVVMTLGWLVILGSLAAVGLLVALEWDRRPVLAGGQGAWQRVGSAILWLNIACGVLAGLAWVQARLSEKETWKRCVLGLASQLFGVQMFVATLDPAVILGLRMKESLQMGNISGASVWLSVVLWALWLPWQEKRKRKP